MDFDKLKQEINHYQLLANDAGVKVNVIGMYQAFYTQHKEKYGSFKRYFGTTKYDEKMQERYDYIFDNINDTIESKLRFV